MSGLEDKYLIFKIKDAPEDTEWIKTPCFLLRYDRDRHARVALRAYAESIMEVNQHLASDLFKELDKYPKDWENDGTAAADN